MTPTIADQLARALADRGVRFAFGMPGGDVLPLLDAFERAGITFVLVRHEGSAGFMAAATWEILGVPGVCVATLGPGATNLVSGAAGAWLDRSRMLVITGHADPRLGEAYTHQVLDHGALFAPVVRATVRLEEGAADALDALLAALDADPPAPVHLDVCARVAAGTGRAPAPPTRPEGETPDLTAAVAALAASRRPAVVVGLGAVTPAASAAVRGLVQALDAPAFEAYKALGVADPDHPRHAGPLGLSPVVDPLQAARLAAADRIVAIGFDPVELRPEWVQAWPDVPVLAVYGTGAPPPWGRVDAALVGDVAGIVEGLAAALPERPPSDWDGDAAHRAAWGAPFDDGPDGPAAATRAVQRGSPPGARLCLDVGAHRITATHAWRADGAAAVLQSNGLCSMATGLPYAIASRIVDPERPCVVITGDMGLLMAAGELGIVVERGLDLVVVVFVDDALSLIELKQERARLGGGGVRFANPDVGALARAFGGDGEVVTGEAEVERAVREAFAAGGLRIVGVRVDPAAYRRQM